MSTWIGGNLLKFGGIFWIDFLRMEDKVLGLLEILKRKQKGLEKRRKKVLGMGGKGFRLRIMAEKEN